MTVETARQEVLEALRHYVESYEASILQFARWMRLPLTDANGLGEVMWAESVGSPTSPTALAARLGITTGAVNALINRLEAKDLLARSRESEDRRAVTLRATSRAQELATPFLSASSRHLFEALDDYEPEQLVMVRDFIERFATILPRSVEGLGRDR